MLKNRFQVSRGRWSVLLGALALVGACGNTKTNSNGSQSGSGGESGWTYLPPGSSNGGATGGNSTTGGTAHAGVAGVGGAVVLPPVTFKCGGTKPSQPIITSFDDFMADTWSSPGNLTGGSYVYPDTLKLTAGNALGFDELVSTYTGIGVYFAGCFDASSYSGVRFTISGDPGMTGTVRFFPVVNRDRNVSTEFSVGACVPDDAADPWPSCHPPEVSLPVTSQPTVHSVPWSAFTGGVPTATTDGSDVLTLEWAFRWDVGGTPYAGKLVIDDVTFYTDEGQGGAGGAGNEAGAAGLGGVAALAGQPGQ